MLGLFLWRHLSSPVLVGHGHVVLPVEVVRVVDVELGRGQPLPFSLVHAAYKDGKDSLLMYNRIVGCCNKQ